ncbi:MAG: tRNA-specific 2-thiouridylase [Verrucomicrobia bacterium]|nr:MAG: tRNA-specific 2-thiouridylase [Verrucomicrobiota bacterium]
MAKILVGLSGGVDSSVAAALLLQQGHEVTAAYMKNWINEENIAGHCPWEEDIRDARAVAETLGIEFKVVNLMRDYRERVVDSLLRGYTEGVTPNPDVLCNREMKFGVFLDHALAEGYEFVATGHYARIRENWDGTRDILRGVDPNKDQTYFLALLRQQQLRHALFPIGHLTKPEVREVAARFGLATAAKKDSQGICFIGEVKMSDFLRHHVPDQPGDIVTTDGRKVGTHRGLHLYTLGQRKGIGVPSNTENKAFVVVEKRGSTRELVVGFDQPDTPGLYSDASLITGLSFCNRAVTESARIEAAPRYRSRAVPVDFQPQEPGPGRALVTWSEPQRALTPGQICVFYEGEVLLGGGIFAEIRGRETF